MDIEKLIEQLNRYFEGKELKRGAALDAATALSTLQAENKRLKSLLGEGGQDLWSKENQRADQLEAELELEREKHQHTQEAAWAHEAELEQVKRALAMMWFAYVNSDKEYPHSYETDALEEAERILGPWKECMPKYLRSGQEED